MSHVFSGTLNPTHFTYGLQKTDQLRLFSIVHHYVFYAVFWLTEYFCMNMEFTNVVCSICCVLYELTFVSILVLLPLIVVMIISNQDP